MMNDVLSRTTWLDARHAPLAQEEDATDRLDALSRDAPVIAMGRDNEELQVLDVTGRDGRGWAVLQTQPPDRRSASVWARGFHHDFAVSFHGSGALVGKSGV